MLADALQMERVAGVDEAGRGPLAGPVVAAAVILPADHPVTGINDSKKLSPLVRVTLAKQIKEHAIAWAIASAEPDEIDRLNILHATMAAMGRALDALSVAPEHALIDGNRCPPPSRVRPVPMTAVVGGDGLHTCIGAASILAKVYRDQLMARYHIDYPQYGFDRHKGYPTVAHMEALRRHGPTVLHRKSFAPVRNLLPPKANASGTG